MRSLLTLNGFRSRIKIGKPQIYFVFPSFIRTFAVVKKSACVKRYLVRLILVAALLCGSFLDFTVKVQGAVASSQQDEKQFKRHDGWIRHVAEEPETVPVSLLRPTTSHRVASSRPTRLLPTHGGKPTNHGGRWTKGESFNPLIFPFLRSCRQFCWHRMTAASPRLRYVIALRRLLC